MKLNKICRLSLNNQHYCSIDRNCQSCPELAQYSESMRLHMESSFGVEVVALWLCTKCLNILPQQLRFMLGFYGGGICDGCKTRSRIDLLNLSLAPKHILEDLLWKE